MLETYLRSHFDKYCVMPIAKLLNKTAIGKPSTVTFISLILGLLLIPCLAWHWAWISIVLLLLSGYLDTLDGVLARLQGSSSQLGSVLDIIADRLVEFSAVLGLYLAAPETRGLLCLLMLGSFYLCVTAFLVVGIFVENSGKKGFFYSIGFIERAETFIFFILMILFPIYFNWLAIILVVLVVITVVGHIRAFYLYSLGTITGE